MNRSMDQLSHFLSILRLSPASAFLPEAMPETEWKIRNKATWK